MGSGGDTEQCGEVEVGLDIVAHVVELADIHGLILRTGLGLIHPVNHVAATAVETGEQHIKAIEPIAGADFEHAVALGLEMDVALLRRVAGIEVGIGGHAQGFVPTRIHFPVVVGMETDVHAGEEAEVLVKARILVSHHTGRQRQPAGHDVMLKEEARIGAAATMVVHAVGAADVFPFIFRLQVAVCRRPYLLAAYVGTHRCLACHPVEVGAERCAVDVGAVIVLTGLGALAALGELVVVEVAMGINHRNQLQRRRCRMLEGSDGALHRTHVAPGPLKLIGEPRRIEGVGAVILRGDAGLPRETSHRRPPVALPIAAPLAEVGIIGAAITLGVAARQRHRTVLGESP